MHQNQRQRLIQEICFSLKLPLPVASSTLTFYRDMMKIENLPYQNQIIVGACIFLSCKVFEIDIKIRDIINIIFICTSLYKLATKENSNGNKNYLQLTNVINRQNIELEIEPSFSLNTYNTIKEKVLEAQQYLLRFIKFDFGNSLQKSSNLKQLLSVCDQLRLPPQMAQTAVNTYNDLEFSSNIVQWIPGILYFSYQLLIASNYILQEIPWEQLFLVPMKKLVTYSEKVIEQYQKLTREGTE